MPMMRQRRKGREELTGCMPYSTRQAITISIMCPVMSFWATLIFQKPGAADFIPAWLTAAAKNLPMAFFYQILFCGPLVRFLFRSMFRENVGKSC